ncbi:PrsW family glutamic-type intramembrane protease [Actinoallomurus rhizosphaericola]|uniref:PrsW family glutamic-type intramembrane protease n=1 Tax=Actinoallomurus rhizosphaericola TaxID=2952536 RepID=UPI0020935746|nr:PrsW family glutamic-type intramembrane protease [Actinoallomurus rhizosphaericola]MCO5999266.1 PrsW family glutamic-type intramembrane protease [Actinoallomurus rhizosphaericola]
MSDVSAGQPFVQDQAQARARALLVARLAIALYLLEVLLNLFRPRVLPNEPALSIFYKLPRLSGSLGRMLSMPRTVFWAALAGVLIAAAVQGLAAITRADGRRALLLTWVTLIVLVSPFTLLSLTMITMYPLTALACVPSALFVLLLLGATGMRWRALLAAFGWGALIVYGAGRAYSGLAYGTINAYLSTASSADLGAALKAEYRGLDLLTLHLSIVNTLAVAAGVLVLLLLVRHRVTDIVTGLALGAVVGLGYSFVDSIVFIRLFGSLTFVNGATGGFEYWIRQSIGLLGGQVTFGALAGAGMGIALRTRERRRRRLVNAAALTAAIGGSVAAEVLSGWFSSLLHEHVGSGGTLDTLVISPLLWLLPQAPFILIAVLLLRVGMRARASAARAAIEAEAADGTAISPAEARFLTSPALRLWSLASTWRRYGRATALTLHRLQTAQLDLVAWRAQADEPSAGEGEGTRLRAKVIQLKTNPENRTAATS